MALVSYFAKWFSHSVTVYTGVQDNKGKFTSSSDQVWMTWMRRQVGEVIDRKGNAVVTTVRLIGAPIGLDLDGRNYRFTLPSGVGPETEMKASLIVPRYDKAGSVDYEVVYL